MGQSWKNCSQETGKRKTQMRKCVRTRKLNYLVKGSKRSSKTTIIFKLLFHLNAILYHYSWFTEFYLASIRCFTGGDTENKDSSSRVEVTEARFTKNYTTLQTLKWTLNCTPWNCFPTNLLQWTQTFFLPLTFTMKWEPVFGEESAN